MSIDLGQVRSPLSDITRYVVDKYFRNDKTLDMVTGKGISQDFETKQFVVHFIPHVGDDMHGYWEDKDTLWSLPWPAFREQYSRIKQETKWVKDVREVPQNLSF